MKPVLRFKDFFNDWYKTEVGKFGNIITGNTPSTSKVEYYGNDVLWVSPGDLGDCLYIKNTQRKLSFLGAKHARVLPQNSILVTCIGSTIGKMGISASELATNQQINSLICNDKNNAIFQFFNIQKGFSNHLSKISFQAIPIISKSEFEKLEFYTTDLEEQTKIATFLNLYYKKIELQRNKVKKFINFKHHVIKSVVNNKGDKYQLCELCQINKGQQLNKLNMLEYGQYKVYNGGISYSGYTNKFNTNENTISISEGGNSCGFVNFINEKFWSGGHNYTLSNLKINTKYLYFILKSCQEDIMKLRVGSGLPNIQKSALEKFQVFIEKNNLSRNLCLFELLEKKNVLEQQKLELLEKYKQGLLQKMFI